MSVAAPALDPVLVGVVAGRLGAVVDEQQATLVRTAFSTIVRESEDLACGVFDSAGSMLAQSRSGTPGHINAMATGVRHFVEAHPQLEPGDALVTNDPWLTAGQVNDMTVVTPVFDGERRVGFFASTCHAPDVGGRLLSAEANDVFEEGLRLPIMKLACAGEVNRDLVAVIEANVRTPRETIGDLYAQMAANEVGARGLLRCLHDLDLAGLDEVGAEICARSERAMRHAISALPDGSYRATTQTDGYREPVHLELTATVQGDAIVLDFTGSASQSDRGINLVLNYTRAYASFAMKAALAPEVPHNAGSFRPVRVVAPEGSVLNCRPPAAVASRHLIGHFLPGLIFSALAPVLEDGRAADGADSIWISVWQGVGGCGDPFNLTLFQSGGMGARRGADGPSATGFPAAVASVPTEVLELATPIVQRRRALIADSGGAGRWRGGLGQVSTFANRSGRPWSVSVLADRTRVPAPGVGGGHAGAAGSLHVDDRPLPAKRLTTLGPGSAVTLRLPGGGGLGEPFERPPADVLADVVDGYVSLAEATDRYGVAIKYAGAPGALLRLPEDYRIDAAATVRLRAATPQEVRT